MRLTASFFQQAFDKVARSSHLNCDLINCIKFVAMQQKVSIDWNEVAREKLTINLDNSSKELFGLIFEPVLLSFENIFAKLLHPIILKFKGSDQYKVLIPNQFGRLNLYNPKLKQFEHYSERISSHELSGAWQCYPAHSLFAVNLSSLLIFVFRFFKKGFLVSFGLGFLSSLSVLLISLISGYIFNHVHDLKEGHNFILFLISLMAVVGSSLVCYLSDLYLKVLSIRVLAVVLPSAWSYMLRLPFGAVKKFTSSDFVQRLTDYEASLSVIFATVLMVVCGVLSFIFLLVYMAYCSLLLAFIYFTIYIIIFIIKLFSLARNAKQINAYFSQQSKTISFLNESLMQIEKIRSSNVAYSMHRRWLYHLLKAKVYFEKSFKLETMLWLIEAIAPASLFLIFYSFFYINPMIMDIHKMLPFMLCIWQLSIHFEKLSTDIVTLTHLLPGLKRLAPILSEDVQISTQMDSSFAISGDVQLFNVSLKSPQTDSAILQDISMDIKRGSFVAIVGKSGAGKSSIFKVLLGLETDYSGLIKVDGNEIKNVDMRSLRKNFGVVLQSTNIFSGSIFSNISVNTNITLDDAWQLAKLVGLDEDIKVMPMRMYTHVSDNPGELISGGQKQKILIARALATHPKILFLDEATSALDNTSQALILDNLKSLNMTRIVIAHRYSTIMDADLIYVLDHGKIIDCGSYKELFYRGRLGGFLK